MKIKITVKFKKGVFNPEGDTIKKTLNHLGYEKIKSVHIERVFILELNKKDYKKENIETIAMDILSNPVIEEYEIEKL